MKAMPQSAGSASRKLLQASSPPAEAPIATIGKNPESLGVPRAGRTCRLDDGRAVLAFRAGLLVIGRFQTAAFGEIHD
jgi:hypothetical protein